MIKRIITVIVLFMIGSCITHSTIESTGSEKISKPENLRMAWWQKAKFGMFIHWGVYAIPAGIWKGEEIEGIGEWIMAYADIPVEEYEKLPPQFNPILFNPDVLLR